MGEKAPKPGSKGCQYIFSSCPTFQTLRTKWSRMGYNGNPLHRRFQKRCELFSALNSPTAKRGKIALDSLGMAFCNSR